MKLGYVLYGFSDEIIRFTKETGFQGVELGMHQDSQVANLDKLTDDDIKRMMDIMQKHQVEFLTVGCSPNHLASDTATRKEAMRYFMKCMKAARKFGTTTVMTNGGGDHALPPGKQIAVYKEVFGEYAKMAEDEGLVIAIENCPHLHTYPPTVGNIFYGPEMWEACFDAVPSKTIGIEFDPSHMHWLQIDYYSAIREFGDRIYAFHAKDTEILEGGLGRYSTIGKQFDKENEWENGWWRYRIPGWGDIDWREIFRALMDAGFDGPMVIEHEDPVFGGDQPQGNEFLGEKTQQGLILGLRHLKQFTP